MKKEKLEALIAKETADIAAGEAKIDDLRPPLAAPGWQAARHAEPAGRRPSGGSEWGNC